MSRLCSAMRWPPHAAAGQRRLAVRRSGRCRSRCRPCRTASGRRMPTRSSSVRPPATPPAGPDSTAPAASREASSTGAMPPCDCTIKTTALEARLGQAAVRDWSDSAARRLDIGVHDRGRDALIFLDLRQHVAGARDADVGQRLRQRARRLRVRGADRDRNAGSTPRPTRA